MPGGIIKGLGITSANLKELLATEDILPRPGSGRLIVAAGVDAAGNYYTLRTDGIGRIQLANFTALTLSDRVEEIDPISQHYVAETLAAVVNGADATYDYYVDMAGYAKGGFQFALDCVAGTVTATIWKTLQDDGTAPAACAYINSTMDLFGVASLVSAAAPAADIWTDDTGALSDAKYLRIRIVAATGGNTGDWTIFHKRLYA